MQLLELRFAEAPPDTTSERRMLLRSSSTCQASLTLGIDKMDGIEENVIDLYGSVRDAYLQRRAAE